MIFTIIFTIIFIVAAIIVASFVSKSKSPKSKGKQVEYIDPDILGKQGEYIVANILGNTIIGEQYVINDLLFQNDLGQSCQIDHIFINKYGIWVIETKNYAGNIFGQENQREWTQVLAYGHTKNKFYNPVKQNATHIYHLSKYLKVKNIFNNVVVFLSHADISHVSSDNVYSISGLHMIKNKMTGITLSVKQMEYYYNKLLELKENANISKDEHIENIYKMKNQIRQGICPRCGGNLVMRNGSNGQFFGCSNYPKCKFTKNIS